MAVSQGGCKSSREKETAELKGGGGIAAEVYGAGVSNFLGKASAMILEYLF